MSTVFMNYPSNASNDQFQQTRAAKSEPPRISNAVACALLESGKRMLLAFREGRHPTFEQLDKLEAALDGMELSLKPQSSDSELEHEYSENLACGVSLIAAERQRQIDLEGKPSPDPIRNLQKAGALIAAEIEMTQQCVCGRPKTHLGACSVRAIANGHRDFEADILSALSSLRRPHSIEEIAWMARTSTPTARKYLRNLEAAGKARRIESGSWIYVAKRFWSEGAR